MTQRLTLPALLDRHLAERPDAPAFIDGERKISYAEFDALCRKSAAWLGANGIGPGDRVAVWLVNRIEWLALLFGLARIGAALVAVNTRFRAAELEVPPSRWGSMTATSHPASAGRITTPPAEISLGMAFQGNRNKGVGSPLVTARPKVITPAKYENFTLGKRASYLLVGVWAGGMKRP